MAAAKQTGMASILSHLLLPCFDHIASSYCSAALCHACKQHAWWGHRDYSLRRVATQKGILLTTYGMVLHNSDALSLRRTARLSSDDNKGTWDFMILDEVRMSLLSALLVECNLPSENILHQLDCKVWQHQAIWYFQACCSFAGSQNQESQDAACAATA